MVHWTVAFWADHTSLSLAYMVCMGACLGSFANVLWSRLPHEESVVWPSSRCPSCRTQLNWYDIVPLFSQVWLKSRCRHCRAPIAARYGLLELLGATLAAALWLRLESAWECAAWLPLLPALLAIVVLDLDYFWIPDVLVYPSFVYLLGASVFPGRLGLWAALAGLLPGGMLAATGALYAWCFKREGLGFGDVKLMAALGLGLGFSGAVTTLMLAAVEGAALGFVALLWGGHRGALDLPVPKALQSDADWQPPAHAVPFGPFLILATLQVLLLPEVFGSLHHKLAERLLTFLSG